jgi:alkanesulfonate monooxygenase SsuD/methylene tetrahydromethanopterin reductase-like flavin-dependent oxidoreductase (luciferase family)
LSASYSGAASERLRERLGRVGVWMGRLAREPASGEREAARQLEALGYGALWIGEALHNREAMSHAAILLGWTSRI